MKSAQRHFLFQPRAVLAGGISTLVLLAVLLLAGTAWGAPGDVSATLFANINPGSTGSAPGGFIDVNGTLFFSADDGTNGAELWKATIEGPAAPPPSTTGTGAQGTNGTTVNPQSQPLRKKLRKAKTKVAKRKLRRKLRALGC
jgi:hypothetical protein